MDFIDKIVEKVNALIKQIRMNTITINGTVVTTSSRSVVIKNGKVIIDGKDLTPESKEINISIIGGLSKLEVDACSKVDVSGDVGSIKTMSGDIDVTGNVTGDIKTMSGDVDCGTVGGSISTMSGDIKNKK